MPGRLAVDFGTSNTVMAVWDEAAQEGTPLHIPDYGSFYQQGDEQIPIVPSLIHYTEDRRQWLGKQVLDQNLYHSPRTFRWMKRYIANRSVSKKRLDGREISFSHAGRDFLSTLLIFASEDLGMAGDEEIAFTVPVEAYEHYEDWLTEVSEAAGMPRFRVIDEPSAAALGYGAHIQPGDVYLIFDFGGGTLNVAVVLIEEEEQAQSGRRCRVLGKAGSDCIGGATIDSWLFQEVLKRNDRSDADEDVQRISNALLIECEAAKERLSSYERADAGFMDPETGSVISAEFTRRDFEDLLEEHEAYNEIDHTVRRAVNASRERGYDEDSIRAVLMVGGSSMIPSVQSTLRRIFGRDRVMLDRPMDAVARGAAAFVGGVDFYDHIQHDYAIRYLNPTKGGYDYSVIVERGTPYPTQGSIARLTVKATYDGQKQLGIAIYEMSEGRQKRSEGPVELVFDPSGAARVTQVTPEEMERRTYFWMNEGSPTFLTADPAGKQGERCFQTEFSIDGNKRLLITARDLRSGRLTHKDYPVVKLT